MLLDEFRALVEASNWTQEEVAQRLFVSRQHVNALLTGKKPVFPATVELLKFRLLQEVPHVLSASPSASAGEITTEDAQILAELQQLSPTDRAAMMAAIRALREARKGEENLRKSLVQPLAHSVRYAPGETSTAPTQGAAPTLHDGPPPAPPVPPASSSSSSSKRPIVPPEVLKGHVSKAEYRRLQREAIEAQLNSEEARRERAEEAAWEEAQNAGQGSPPSPTTGGPTGGTSRPSAGTSRRPKSPP